MIRVRHDCLCLSISHLGGVSTDQCLGSSSLEQGFLFSRVRKVVSKRKTMEGWRQIKIFGRLLPNVHVNMVVRFVCRFFLLLLPGVVLRVGPRSRTDLLISWNEIYKKEKRKRRRRRRNENNSYCTQLTRLGLLPTVNQLVSLFPSSLHWRLFAWKISKSWCQDLKPDREKIVSL
jgi:hypothetical protein